MATFSVHCGRIASVLGSNVLRCCERFSLSWSNILLY